MGNINSGYISLNAARVGAKDVPVLAKFYEAAFGLKIVKQIQLPIGPEIMLNFGDTVEAAMANPAAQIVIMPKADTDGSDSVGHIIFNASDVKAAAETVKAAGGTIVSEPVTMGDGVVFCFVADPDGNLIELLKLP